MNKLKIHEAGGGAERLKEPEEQTVYCEIVSPRDVRDAAVPSMAV